MPFVVNGAQSQIQKCSSCSIVTAMECKLTKNTFIKTTNKSFIVFPINTRRYLDVNSTLFVRYGRQMDVKTASCAYWVTASCFDQSLLLYHNDDECKLVTGMDLLKGNWYFICIDHFFRIDIFRLVSDVCLIHTICLLCWCIYDWICLCLMYMPYLFIVSAWIKLGFHGWVGMV